MKTIESSSPLATWLRRLGVVCGLAAILIPLFGFRRTSRQPLGQRTGMGTHWLSWPVTMTIAGLYLYSGIRLWRPLPLRLSRQVQSVCLAIGAALYFPGVALYLWGYKNLGRLFSPSSTLGAQLYATHELVTQGPYRYLRHPMYAGVLLAASGALLMYRTWAMVLFGLSSLVVIPRSRREDRLLSESFPAAWPRYQEQGPGWIPRFG